MTTEQEKWLALQQETEGLQWFITGEGTDDEKVWEGVENEESEKWSEWCIAHEDSDEDSTFEEWLKENGTEVELEDYDENGDWLVCTDSEADEKWDEDLDNFIDECVLPEIPKAYRNYFDDEGFKQDCKIDGRGHSLARYDGHEQEQEVNGTTYYLYRQN